MNAFQILQRISVCLIGMFVLVACLLMPAASAETSGNGERDEGASGLLDDPWLAEQLQDVDTYAARYPDAYADELARYLGASRSLVESLRDDQDWSAGELYFACAVAHAQGRNCRDVVVLRRNGDQQRDWAIVLRTLEVDDADALLLRVKQGLVQSYDRWARPITLDDALRRHPPERL